METGPNHSGTDKTNPQKSEITTMSTETKKTVTTPKLTIILLCRNRTEYALTALKSILDQNNSSLKIIISDNSTNKIFMSLVAERYPNVRYKSWFPGINQIEHMQEAIKLVETPYFTMFHDDDIMETDYSTAILEQFRLNPTAVAVATNGITIRPDGTQITKNKIGSQYNFRKIEDLIEFTNQSDFLRQYLSGDCGGAAAFCSYAYNNELIGDIRPEPSIAGNFFDTVFLTKLIRRGPIIWLNRPLVRVRVHHETVSSLSNLDYKIFVNYVRKTFCTIKERDIVEYRLLRLFALLAKKNKPIPLPALKYFIVNFPSLAYHSDSFRKRFARKILTKLLSFRMRK